MVRGLRLLLLLLAMLAPAIVVVADDEAPRLTVDTLNYRLTEIERRVGQSKGVAQRWSEQDRKIFGEIMELSQKYPKDEKVSGLVSRARKLYQAGQGNVIEITEEMLAYRKNDAELSELVAKAGADYWPIFRAAMKDLIEKPFPASDPEQVGPDVLNGQSVVLEQVNYSSSLFVELGTNWLYRGSPSDGLYFIDASGRSFNILYEAIDRFRGTVDASIPDEWTIAGRVVGARLLTPDKGGGDAAWPAHFGWVVDPVAIWIPGVVLVHLDESAEVRGVLVGEDQAKKFREGRLTPPVVSAQASAEDVVRLYITALKEKNWELYVACLEADAAETEVMRGHLRYLWEQNLKGLATTIVHAEPTRADKIVVLSGTPPEAKALDEFFGDADKSKAGGNPLVEQIRVWVEPYNEHGRQVATPRPVTLRRVDRGRWYIVGGIGLTF